MAVDDFQQQYEAALGQFLVAFNSIESLTTDLVILALAETRKGHLTKRLIEDNFERRVTALELLASALPQLDRLPVSELRRLGGERNKLAHGHLDQDPNGEFSIRDIQRRKNTDINLDRILKLALDARTSWNDLRNIEICFWFDEVTEEHLAETSP